METKGPNTTHLLEELKKKKKTKPRENTKCGERCRETRSLIQCW